MLRFTCLLLVVACCLADDLNLKDHWGKFKSTFKKSFSNKNQESLKQVQWENKVKSILKHNMDADLGVHSFKLAVNEFSDLSQAEFAQKLLGLKVPSNITYNYLPPNSVKSERALPPEHDWRKVGIVTSVKSQGSCGSCWSFGVTGAMEGAYGFKTGKAVDFSQQQLVDCSVSYGPQGCDGGWPNDAFKYIKDYGIEADSCYPYETTQKTCRYNSNCVYTKISNYYDVPKNEKDLQQYLFNYGPISVCIYVNDKMQSYGGGIFNDPACTGYVNHAVLLVGYGTENGQDYWTIKNSWGSGWGEQGYIRIARNANNMCRIVEHASFPYL